MATSTIGSNPLYNNWLFDASMNQAWIGSYSIGDTVGRMIQVLAQFAAAAGGGAGGAVAWKNGSSASLYTNSGPIGAGNGGTGGGTASRTSSGDNAFLNTDNWQFGFYCANGVFTAYHSDGGNSYVSNNGTNAPTSTNNYSAYGSGGGSQIAYGTYFIIETYVRTTVWNKTLTYVDTAAGNHWSAGDVYVYTTPGGGLTQVGQLVRRNELWYEREKRGWFPDGTPVLLRWAYDEPKYLGFGYPGDPSASSGSRDTQPYELAA